MKWMSQAIAIICAILVVVPASSYADESEPLDLIGGILDGFHEAASKADGERYFGFFASDAIFLGTDVTERWTVDEFRTFAEPSRR